MKKKSVIYGALIFVLLFWMCSCGARKLQKSQSKEETKTTVTDNSTTQSNTDTNVKTTTTVKVDDKNENVTEETIIEPVDASKESFVIGKDGTKVVLNNAKKIVRKTTQKNNTKTELFGNSEQLKKEAVKEQKVIKQESISKKEKSSKELDKKQYNPFNLILFGSIGLLFLWCIYRFYKKLPLVPKF